MTQARSLRLCVVLTQVSILLGGRVQGAGLGSPQREGGPRLWPLGVGERSPFRKEASALLTVRPSAASSRSQLTEPPTRLPGSGFGVRSRIMRE